MNRSCRWNQRRIGRILLCRFLLGVALLSGGTLACAESLHIVYTGASLISAPLWVTREAGLFKKYNLDADSLVYIAGGTPSVQALIGGDIQIAFTAGGAVVAANLSGSDVLFIGANMDVLPFEVWTIPAIKHPSQLKGTRMGVSRLGSTSDFVARYLLKKWGLKPSGDVVVFQTGGIPEVFAALKGGSIQSGIMSAGPFTLQAQKEGFARLADVSTSGLAYLFGPIAARQSFLQSHRETVSRFMKAYVEGIHRFKTDRKLALAAIEKYTRVKTTPAMDQIYDIYASRYIKKVPEATAEGIQTILDEISASRPLPADIRPQRFVESRFIKEIAESGFADALYRGH